MSRRSAPTIRDIAELLGLSDQVRVLEPAVSATTILRPAAADQATAGDITFIGFVGSRGSQLLSRSSATLALVPDDPALRELSSVPLKLACANPRLAFIRTVERFFAPERPTGVHRRAVVEDGAILASTVYVGPLATIGGDVSVGERTVIHAGAHVYPGCRIGADCTIHAGAVIGADGFGYERNEDGAAERFPHVGTVVIEDDVEIGANACIDRGTLGATIIRSGARIDNLVYIAHNVEVGRGALVVATTMVAGGARLGERSWIAPSIIRDGISVGADATVGLGAVVINDVPAGATVAGSPARDLAELNAMQAQLRLLATTPRPG